MMGDMKFNFLCRRYADDVYRFARSLMGNDEDAADASQDVMVKLWENIDNISTLKGKAWMMRTTRNHCFNLLRSRRRVSAVFVYEDSIEANHPDASIAEPDTMAEASDIRQRIDKALSQLSESHRTVFILHEVNGMKYREIADSMGIPVNSVKVYLLRARRKLQESLESTGQVP
jgi:RNA polymerase sigma-70 factor (ECF subfamily)